MTFREHANSVRRKNVGLHTRDICITIGFSSLFLARPPSGIMKKNYASVFLTGVYYASESRERFVSCILLASSLVFA